MTTYTNSTQGNMTLSGATELTSVAINVGKTAGSQMSMNDTDTRALAGITTPGAQISFSDFYAKPTPSQANFLTPGTFTWYPPAGVTSVGAVCIGAGGGGGGGFDPNAGGAGGGGGGLIYLSAAAPVRPRPLSNSDPITVIVGAGGTGGSTNALPAVAGGSSSIQSTGTYLWSITAGGGGAGRKGVGTGASGGTTSSSGGVSVVGFNGGGSGQANTLGGSGGGGAAGYAGAGGTSTNAASSTFVYGGGGCGIFGGTAGGGAAGTATSGTGSNGGTNGNPRNVVPSGGTYGGGGGGGDDVTNSLGGSGAQGAVRIVWGNFATTRSYPNTNVSTNL